MVIEWEFATADERWLIRGGLGRTTEEGGTT